ncbi:hypothetical protein CASFOL_033197 [Castilleja foliolosa]|uniref:Uncharacterized protein n=1 Tax=Castilleja foliolosa TaxID=1961234 RepID=A0ABD3C045_9LAMI
MEEAYHHLLHYYSEPHPHNPNINYHEPAYNFYEPHEPEIYYDYYEPPSEQESTLYIIAELTQKLDERLESMENQMNERFDKLEEEMGQVAKTIKELQSQEMNEQVWTSPVALDVEPLVSLVPVHFDIAEEIHDDVVSKTDPLVSKTYFDIFDDEKRESLVVEDIVEPPVDFFYISVNAGDYSRFRPPKVEEARVCRFSNSKTFPTTRLAHLCHPLQVENTKVWHEKHLFLDPG